ncbi:hypothetical protein HDU91_001433, partial [Kappamyces sp. JEL0680]
MLNKRICGNCQRANEQYQKITATRAKSEFKLTERDLEDIPCVHVQNPYYRSSAPMRLYRLIEVKAAAQAKHGGEQGLEEKKRKSAEAAEKRAITKKKKVDDRGAILRTALESVGLELRQDSRLCQDFISGK